MTLGLCPRPRQRDSVPLKSLLKGAAPLRIRLYGAQCALQTVNKARKRKNSKEQFKNCKNFCLLRQLQLQMAVTYV